MKQNETNLVPKSSEKFVCEYCDYSTSRLSQYSRHLSTQKHKKCDFETKMKQNETKSLKKFEKFQCDCGIEFNSRTSLWRHKRKCNFNNELELTDKEIITALMEQNEKLLKIVENGQSQTSSIISNMHNNNSNNIHTNMNNVGNKTFNLNLFLNETCKDAFNMNDFVSSIKVNLEDLENTGRHGYIQGITSIFLKNLNSLEKHMRPLHCSDSKREVMYVKHNNEWTKEAEGKPILTRAIKVIANENIKQIQNWKNKYPDCTDIDSKKNNLWLKIVSNSMNGLTEEEGIKNINKIISNVAKEVTINK
jgi:hypothetical protein